MDKQIRFYAKRSFYTSDKAKEMMDVFFYRIIAVDKHEIVVTIDGSNTITLDKFRANRKEKAQMNQSSKEQLNAKTHTRLSH